MTEEEEGKMVKDFYPNPVNPFIYILNVQINQEIELENELKIRLMIGFQDLPVIELRLYHDNQVPWPRLSRTPPRKSLLVNLS